MYQNLEKNFSKLTKRMKKSEIRELLKLTKKPGLISFAGGLPAPCTFPVKELLEITREVLENEASLALQYGTTEGDDLLRQQLTKRYQSFGLNITTENLVITTSSQQALDFLGRVFINEGDKVIVGLPSYLGGIQAFNVYGANLVGVKHDEKGMSAIELEKTLAELKEKGEKPKFIYVIPDFQNPAGVTMPESRRREIIEIAHKYEILIVEDSPYRELRFEGEPQPTIYQLDEKGTTITLGTFSKIFRISTPINAMRVKKLGTQTKFEAQKIAFAPVVFQAAKAMLDFKVLETVEKGGDGGVSREEIADKTGLSEYAVEVLTDSGLSARILYLTDSEHYGLTNIGMFLIRDEMTRVNINFVHDVCYQGMYRLQESLKEGAPAGLRDMGSWDTIYDALASLPERLRPERSLRTSECSRRRGFHRSWPGPRR